MTQVDELLARLEGACNGHPHAKIAWPHRLLHDAATLIRSLVAERDALQRRVAENETYFDKCVSNKYHFKKVDYYEAKVDAAEAENAVLREALEQMRDRDEQCGSLPYAYRNIIDTVLNTCNKEQPKPAPIVEDDDDYHKPDASGYSRADEEWFFDMDGKP